MEQNILEKIVTVKRTEIASLKTALSPDIMRKSAENCARVPISMSASILTKGNGIIAEFKRKSPSKGEIHAMANAAKISAGYAHNGAAAISVLTDTVFFGGSITDLAVARRSAPSTPLLKKDFIIDSYQIDMARTIGADAILLIASILDPKTVELLAHHAHSYNMEVLLELHNLNQIKTHGSIPGIDMVGINNRDLTNFHTDCLTSLNLVKMLPFGPVKIAESGIRNPEDILKMKSAGFEGFLIGEAFMSTPEPPETLKSFIDECKTK